ncbi:MAG TPA: hypothetical protein VJB87_00160 [Candidatus Nanoarchaeia archaeon]|nr:hypothetical protein [Candidatus Nanoarchaeia archaeon]
MQVKKRGVELPSSTIITFVLLAVALAVLAYFFLSGAGKTTGTISDIFKSSTAGVSRDLAIETCYQRCRQIESYPLTLAKKSAFCTSPFRIDDDGDGAPEEYVVGDQRKAVQFYCGGNKNKVSGVDSLEIGCSIIVDKIPTALDCN